MHGVHIRTKDLNLLVVLAVLLDERRGGRGAGRAKAR